MSNKLLPKEGRAHCDCCGRYFSVDDILGVCRNCQKKICKEGCGFSCDICKKINCVDHMKSCKECERNFCDKCSGKGKKCEGCKEWFCENCASNFTDNNCPNCAPKSKCFIATAAYGTPSAHEINILRVWRDTTLKTTSSGRAFIKTYYIVSPTIAKLISRSKLLRATVRKGLDPVIKYIKQKN